MLTRAGRCQTVHAKSKDPKAPSPQQVKEVLVSDDDDEAVQRRYIVCRNEDRATKDAHDRSVIGKWRVPRACLSRGETISWSLRQGSNCCG